MTASFSKRTPTIQVGSADNQLRLHRRRTPPSRRAQPHRVRPAKYSPLTITLYSLLVPSTKLQSNPNSQRECSYNGQGRLRHLETTFSCKLQPRSRMLHDVETSDQLEILKSEIIN